MNKSPGQHKQLFITLLIQRENFKKTSQFYSLFDINNFSVYICYKAKFFSIFVEFLFELFVNRFKSPIVIWKTQCSAT